MGCYSFFQLQQAMVSTAALLGHPNLRPFMVPTPSPSGPHQQALRGVTQRSFSGHEQKVHVNTAFLGNTEGPPARFGMLPPGLGPQRRSAGWCLRPLPRPWRDRVSCCCCSGSWDLPKSHPNSRCHGEKPPRVPVHVHRPSRRGLAGP